MAIDTPARGIGATANKKFSNITNLRVSEGNYQYSLDNGSNWTTLSGGGIGTLDYNDLTNKPIIRVAELPTEDILLDRIYQVGEEYYIMSDFSSYTQTLPPIFTTEVPNGWTSLYDGALIYYNNTGLFPFPSDFTGSFNCSLSINGVTYSNVTATCLTTQGKNIIILSAIPDILDGGGFIQNGEVSFVVDNLRITTNQGNSACAFFAPINIVSFEILEISPIFQKQKFLSDFQYDKLNNIGINTLNEIGNKLFVDALLGSDDDGNGSAGLPFATIRKAVNIATSMTDVDGFELYISFGTYDETAADITLPAKPIRIYGNNATIQGNIITQEDVVADSLTISGTISGTGTWRNLIGLIDGSDEIGDIFYRNSDNNIDRLQIGVSNKVLKSNGTLPEWSDVAHNDTIELQGGTTGEYYHLTSTEYIRFQQSRILFSQTAAKTNACNGTLQTIIGTGIGSVIIPANTLKVGDLIHFIADGIVSATSNDSITLTVKFNDVTLYTQTTATNITFTNTPYNNFGDIVIRTIGATGSVAIGGTRNIFAAVGFGTATSLPIRGTATIDTTVDNEIKIEYSAPTGASITSELLTITKNRND